MSHTLDHFLDQLVKSFISYINTTSLSNPLEDLFKMKIPITFLLLTFLPIFLNAKPKPKTLHLPLVALPRPSLHSPSTSPFLDSKILNPPLTAPYKWKGLAFLAEIFVGSRRVRQFLHVDTGSSLTWIQCHPCSKCYDHIYPKYWPKDSTTYLEAECESTGENPEFTYYHLLGKCLYEQQYADGNYIEGTLANEMFSIRTPDGKFEAVHDVYMGCNDRSLGQSYIGTGILGLGFGNFSLVEKLGSKFSICIGRIGEHGSTNNLILGDGANIQGYPTRIIISHGHYMFQLESIRVGETMTSEKPLQVYVDTGSTVSYLPEDLYEDVLNEVKKLIRVEPYSERPMLCYKMDASKIPEDVDIGFEFAGGAELSVDVRSFFVATNSETLCLGIKENSEDDQRILIGAVGIQGYNLGYDIKAQLVYQICVILLYFKNNSNKKSVRF